MMKQPTTDHPPGMVIEEIVKGYRLRDRVLRPTRVIVSAEPEKERGEESDEPAGEEKKADGESRKDA